MPPGPASAVSVRTDLAEPVPGGLLDELLRYVSEHAPDGRAEAIREFARAYVRRAPREVVTATTVEELFAEILGLFQLADGRGDAPTAVRALNPNLATDGYRTAGSVIETNCADSPFLVDSVSNELVALGHEISSVSHPIIGIDRSESSRIRRVLHARDAARRESVMHYELSRRLRSDELEHVAERIQRALAGVQSAVRDFQAMRARVGGMIEAAHASHTRYQADEIEEAVTFLEWLLEENFVLLGYREYSMGEGKVTTMIGRGLGILAGDSASRYAEPVALDSIAPSLRARLLGENLLVVSKTNRLSTVHRRAKMDDITVLRAGPDGKTVGAFRLLGLFTRSAYLAPADEIPVLSRKLRQIAVAEDLLPGSHDYKALVELFESFPKDELFATSAIELRETLIGLLRLQERRNIELFVHPDSDEGRVSVLVAVPRDRFSGALRQRIEQMLLERFRGTGVDYHLALGESEHARMHFSIYAASPIPDVSVAELEQGIAELARTWDDRLRERLVVLHGLEAGNLLADKYSSQLPDYYKSAAEVSLAIVDIEHFERLGPDELFVVGLKNEREHDERLTRIGLYKTGGKATLSDFLPILEHLGLTVVTEVPTRLDAGDSETYLHDFGVLDAAGATLDLALCGDRVADCIEAVFRGDAESDSLNRLVVSAGLTWQQVVILRAYRAYRQRLGAAFGLEYESDAFAGNPDIAARLLRLFECRFDPTIERDQTAEDALVTEIQADLDLVPSLDQDRILRAYLGLMQATVRTGAFLPGRSYVSFKLESGRVPDMPRPAPLYEIFVYSAHMEGIHLRGGRVARGGIRHSERLQDYRTEILGLMKAQMIKNVVIVPVGSKGGFVVKRPPTDRHELADKAAEHYRTLIRGLLDLTDNLVDGQPRSPEGVRVLDESDPYLVVAADKGTATFSDIANEIAGAYSFWLGDAFASGGSSGYDHKKLGITARGAWESVKRHFRELGQDIETEPLTVVGIGDMSGDVFGNGMLLSDRIRLIAAFDHRNVFIDPDPDPDGSFSERRRLFELPGSSWDDYDREKISPGGGVWSRREKTVALAPAARAALGIADTELTPAGVIAAILRAPADLLWNGGIGTFVKAEHEDNVAVGDRANDAVRASGAELRVKVVAEGGNLGFTQKGRIEYARAGGRINIDAIDNSAGVDCSDHEVNLKILLGLAMARGELTRDQRDELLREVENDVTDLVLYDTYLQAQVLSQEAEDSSARLEAYEDLMARLEAADVLDRELESLPSSDEMAERLRASTPMARPELCVLLAFAKRDLEETLRASELLDEPYLRNRARAYFPKPVVERLGHLIPEHPLRRDLLATLLANEVVNALGITFVSRLSLETGAEPEAVIRAYLTGRDATGAVDRWDRVEALDGKVDAATQARLMSGVDALVADVARWYLLNAPSQPVADAVLEAAPVFRRLSSALERGGSAEWHAAREEVAAELEEAGVATDLARAHAFERGLVYAPDVLRVAERTGRAVEEVLDAFLLGGERLHLEWLEEQLDLLDTESRFERWAARAMADDLLALRRVLAERALAKAEEVTAAEAVLSYLDERTEAVARLERLAKSLAAEDRSSLAGLTVAVRQARSIAT